VSVTDDQIDYFLEVMDDVCAKFDKFDSGLPTHRPEAMSALRATMRVFLAEANMAEREECAKVCEARAMETVPDDSAIDELYFAAAAIRARSQP
jgi:hypothetical protein